MYEPGPGTRRRWELTTCRPLTPSTVSGFEYHDQGKLAEAEEMYARALAGFRKSVGSEHPSIVTVMNNLQQLA